MTDISQQVEAIEKEIRETPYHKGTEHHIGRLRARLARLRDKLIEDGARQKHSHSGGQGGYAVKKQGDATVVIVGPPSVGKSTLLNKLTNAKSKIAPYDFTTVSVIPGMMKYKDAKIQILDVPGLIKGAEEGRGKGREVLSVARGADLLIVLCDVERKKDLEKVISVLEKSGIRINKEHPPVTIEKRVGGGIVFHSNISQDLNIETIKEVAKEFGIKNAEITLTGRLTMDNLIDAFSQNRVYVPAIFVVNKSDLIYKEAKNIQRVTGAKLNHPSGDFVSTPLTYILISAREGNGLSELKALMWDKLNLVRIYLVRKNEDPSFKHPIVIKQGQTLYDVAQKIGSEFAEDKDRAKIWGSGAKFPGQEVSLSTKIAEGMQVRFV